jgi:hypothetical protein
MPPIKFGPGGFTRLSRVILVENPDGSMQLLEHVPEEVDMSALSWALHVALGQRARTTLASLAPCLGLAAPTLPP